MVLKYLLLLIFINQADSLKNRSISEKKQTFFYELLTWDF